MSDYSHLKIGDTLWFFSANNRVYRAGGGPPIYSHHFRPYTIDGETKPSWVMSNGEKVNKKTLASAGSHSYGGRGYFTAEGMAADIWDNDHRQKIIEVVRRIDVPTLKAIAKIVKYEDSAP